MSPGATHEALTKRLIAARAEGSYLVPERDEGAAELAAKIIRRWNSIDRRRENATHQERVDDLLIALADWIGGIRTSELGGARSDYEWLSEQCANVLVGGDVP